MLSKSESQKISQTLISVYETIIQLLNWNKNISSAEDYYSSEQGMQLLAANCTLITAIGEGINRINRVSPEFLKDNFPEVPWRDIIGMRNHIAHGYFELDAELVYESIATEFPELLSTISTAIEIINKFEN
ncbi:MAG: DUF86 domain-containing protein [Muribaculaceae bacterium]|nr:DUF86 domain-containing protein [Muribaculaceae bacterium]